MSTLSEQAIGPSQRMENLLAGHYSAQCVHVIAVLGIPDLLANGHTTVESLASAAHCDPPSLRRVLRMLVRLGLFTESAQDQFQLTPLGATLRSDVADSMRDRAIAQVELWRRA
jgi:DNA-binding IclR family transcriptional regulator